MTGRYRNWIFTANFDDDGKPPSPWPPDMKVNNIRYIIYQTEKVSRLHYQGLIIFKHPRRFSSVKTVLGETVHFEVMKGTLKQAIRYCTKKKTRIEPPVEFGDPPKQGLRQDLITFVETVDNDNLSYDDAFFLFPEIFSRYPRYVEKLFQIRYKRQANDFYRYNTEERLKRVIIYYGEAGSGKTSRVFKKHDLNNIYTLTFGDGSSKSLWFDDYQGEKILLIDDFYGQIKYSYLLRLLDIYPMRVQCKGGYNYVNFETIYFTSNEHPDEWYSRFDTSALERRFTKIKEITIETKN